MKEALEQKSREELECEIIELKRQLVEANEMIRKLSEQVEELQRTGKRQAVPFARREEHAFLISANAYLNNEEKYYAKETQERQKTASPEGQ